MELVLLTLSVFMLRSAATLDDADFGLAAAERIPTTEDPDLEIIPSLLSSGSYDPVVSSTVATINMSAEAEASEGIYTTSSVDVGGSSKSYVGSDFGHANASFEPTAHPAVASTSSGLLTNASSDPAANLAAASDSPALIVVPAANLAAASDSPALIVNASSVPAANLAAAFDSPGLTVNASFDTPARSTSTGLAATGADPATRSTAAASFGLTGTRSRLAHMLFHVLKKTCSEGAAQGMTKELGKEQNRINELHDDLLREVNSSFVNLQGQLQEHSAHLQDQRSGLMSDLDDLVTSERNRQVDAIQGQYRQHRAHLQELFQPITPLLNQLVENGERQMTSLQTQLTSSEQRLSSRMDDIQNQEDEQSSVFRSLVTSSQSLNELLEDLQAQQQQMTAVQRHQEQEMSSLKDLLTSTAANTEKQLKDLQNHLSSVQNMLRSPARQACPDGWIRHSDGCYIISSSRASWTSAKRLCSSMDSRSQLASVHRENDDLVTSLASSAGESVWIGLTRRSSSRSTTRWAWVDGSPLDFTNWASGEPNNGRGFWSRDSGNENCVLLRSSGVWNDEGCAEVKRFMCQITLK
ncbi:C-type lectin domain family 4 member F-like [Amphibalanus amphitrite]|uniref:C-type lectin domain family 4 member F-like n=1 Tax=Amphibalanus amphitrite TaxID=1232801 RepID=UPI001C906C1B|nr:C-type lectin domain family 4 member F-like [Amphibalanus amphitrite]